MSYIYDNEDNAPMNEESMPKRYEYNPPRPDRDCPNCRYKMPNGECTKWSCDFAPKQHVIEEVQEWLAKTSSANAGTGAK